ncbi:MAG: glycoside hydrolase family 32 protein [Paenibacillus sp.]|nr:glycoside hydrolase family 32 protein [Paenibacillus sp.]
MRQIFRTFAISVPVVIASLAMTTEARADETELYSEPYRPQYHFTPAHRWIGDPCGLVYRDSTFRAYSWGGAESGDLIHWTEVNDNAIRNIPKGISPFTGSVVVDKDNTAGYGPGAYIAAFTSFDEGSKKQSQSIAFSLDGGVTYNYYDLNPVLDIWSTEFRDPTVIWDARTSRWIMLVAKALEKKVAFYASADLKHWEWLSDFGPMGDSERSWECPDMFQLPVEGKPGVKKWVLLVSVNWAREQYFVGDFDGTRFIPDRPDQAPAYVDEGLDYYASRVFQDYDGTLPEVYTLGWVSTWDYAQHVPTAYGKGVWSLPRAMYLRESGDGYKLCQRPYSGLEELREAPVNARYKLKPGVTRLDVVSRMDNSYELEVEIDTRAENTIGLNLCAGSVHKVTLSYDTRSEILMLDRTAATGHDIPKFSRIAFSKVAPVDGKVKLNIFVDRSVIEVFADGGATVMTALTFPDSDGTGVELTALRPGSVVNVTAWHIKSIWKSPRH